MFLDETGMRLNYTRTHGRSKRGKRCHGQRPKPKGKIVTLIGAMCITGVIASLMFEGGTNTETFLFFVREILVPTLWKGAVVIMDNLNVHTNQLVVEAIESVGARVLFLPTYSPELNPIEMLWSKLKAFLRKLKPRTRADLDAAVSTFIASLQQKDLLGYFLETEARTVFI